jgi:hypothetical protein
MFHCRLLLLLVLKDGRGKSFSCVEGVFTSTQYVDNRFTQTAIDRRPWIDDRGGAHLRLLYFYRTSIIIIITFTITVGRVHAKSTGNTAFLRSRASALSRLHSALAMMRAGMFSIGMVSVGPFSCV